MSFWKVRFNILLLNYQYYHYYYYHYVISVIIILIIILLFSSTSTQYCPNPFSPTLNLECSVIKLGQNFTQADVDLNRIRYVHTTRMGSTQGDGFVFVLTDGTHRRHEETFEIKVQTIMIHSVLWTHSLVRKIWTPPNCKRHRSSWDPQLRGLMRIFASCWNRFVIVHFDGRWFLTVNLQWVPKQRLCPLAVKGYAGVGEITEIWLLVRVCDFAPYCCQVLFCC